MNLASRQCWFPIIVLSFILTEKAYKMYQAIQQRQSNEIYWNGFFILFATGVIIYNILRLRKLRQAAV